MPATERKSTADYTDFTDKETNIKTKSFLSKFQYSRPSVLSAVSCHRQTRLLWREKSLLMFSFFVVGFNV